MKSVSIGTFRIGPDDPCFIIAEAGVNHNGDVTTAKKLVDAALGAQADAVKFQTWVTDKIMVPDAPAADYQKQNVGGELTQYEIVKQLELAYDEFEEIKAYCDRVGIMFLSTPDEEESADFLNGLGVPCFKVGSGEVTNLPLLRHVALKGKPVILSTGMSHLGEVESAVIAMEEVGNLDLILLHCVSNYPADPVSCNLKAIDTLACAFGYPVGFSDHTLGYEVTLAAVARGAQLVEKHLTLDKTMPGPDHKASLNPAEFGSMVKAVRGVEAALGDGIKRPVSSELEMRRIARRTVVASRPIAAGQTIVAEDLALRRSSGGLDPANMKLIIGRRPRRDLDRNSVITVDLLL
jgi:N,N'-diacetyllegionaminate synthase